MSMPEKIRTVKTQRLQSAVKTSTSYSQALRKLGVDNANGRNIATLRTTLRRNRVSTKHFAA